MRLQGEAAEKPVHFNKSGAYRTFSTMGILNINDIKEGMTLAADVKNKHGNIMIRQGMALTEKHIMLLKAWGIAEADVDGFDRDQLHEDEMKTVSPEVSSRRSCANSSRPSRATRSCRRSTGLRKS